MPKGRKWESKKHVRKLKAKVEYEDYIQALSVNRAGYQIVLSRDVDELYTNNYHFVPNDVMMTGIGKEPIYTVTQARGKIRTNVNDKAYLKQFDGKIQKNQNEDLQTLFSTKCYAK